MIVLELVDKHGGRCGRSTREMVFGMKSLEWCPIYFIYRILLHSRKFERITLSLQNWLKIGKT